MRRKLISFRPRTSRTGRYPGEGCYFKVYMEQESGTTLLSRRKLLSWILVDKPWTGAVLFRASAGDDEGWELVNGVAQHMLDHVLVRVGYPFPTVPGIRW